MKPRLEPRGRRADRSSPRALTGLAPVRERRFAGKRAPVSPSRATSSLSLAASVSVAALVFVASLAALSAVAGWDTVFDGFRAQWSFYFAVAFGAELAALASYIFAYRAVASIERGPVFSLGDAAALVAVGFGAFLARGGAALDSAVFRKPGDSKASGEVRV